MKGLKKQLAKSFINIRLVSSKPGEIVIHSNALSKIEDDFKVYDKQVEQLVKILEGIESVTPNYETNTVTIVFDPAKLTAQQVIKWVEILEDVFIEYLEVIQQNWENNFDYVMQVLTEVLIKSLKQVK